MTNHLPSLVVVDLETPVGKAMAKSAVSHVKYTNQMRVGITHHTPKPGVISRAAAAGSLDAKKRLRDPDIPAVAMNRWRAS